jgi:hypothetical protein
MAAEECNGKSPLSSAAAENLECLSICIICKCNFSNGVFLLTKLLYYYLTSLRRTLLLNTFVERLKAETLFFLPDN